MGNDFNKPVENKAKKIEKPVEKEVDGETLEDRVEILETLIKDMLDCYNTSWHIASLTKLKENYDGYLQNRSSN